MKKLINRVLTLVAVATTLTSFVGYAREGVIITPELPKIEQVAKKTQDASGKKLVAEVTANTQALGVAQESGNKDAILKAEHKLETSVEKAKSWYESAKDYLGEMSTTKKMVLATIGIASAVAGVNYLSDGAISSAASTAYSYFPRVQAAGTWVTDSAKSAGSKAWSYVPSNPFASAPAPAQAP